MDRPYDISVQCDGAAASQTMGALPLAEWCVNVLKDFVASGGVDIRIVDEAEMARNNRQFRSRAGPTNVLSFPAEIHPEVGSPLLGDLLICAPVVAREARQQGKTIPQHLAHMVTHGTLHLLGFDHEDEADAVRMEHEEVRLLARIDVPDPYAQRRNQNAD